MRTVLLRMSLMLLCGGVSVFAHESLHEQIAGVSRLIAASPADAKLFLRRANLRRLHADWPEAERDYAAAARLDPSLPGVDLGRARMHLERGDPRSALEPARRVLKRDARNEEALLALGRAQARLDMLAEASESYATLARLQRRPSPDVVLEHAGVLEKRGDRHGALRQVDHALARLGLVISLQLRALELSLSIGDVEQALVRLSAIERQAARKETWLARRGDILFDTNRHDEAADAYRSALRELAERPPRRTSAALRELQKHAEARISQIDREREIKLAQ